MDAAQAGKVYTTLASVHLNREEYRSAELCARQALTYFRGARLGREQAAVLRMLAELLHHEARLDDAAECWSLALSLLEAVDERQDAAEVRERLAEATGTAPAIPLERTEPMRARPTSEFTR
jgi:tetratricopeptide (TPR) repeat protein